MRRVEDLAALPLLHTRTRPGAWADWAGRAGWAGGDPPAGGTSYEHFYFLLEAAVAGLGACVAPWPLVMGDLAAGRLVAPFGSVASGLSYVALRRPRRDPAARAFCAWLAEEAAATPPAPYRPSAAISRL